MSDSAPDVLRGNVERMVRRWADPVTDGQLRRSRDAFVGKVRSEEAAGPRRGPLRSLPAVAASLIVAATVLWAFLSSGRSTGPGAPAPVLSGPRDDEKRIRDLIAKLGSDQPEDREAAEEALRRVGRPALPLLKEAFKATGDAEARSRLSGLIGELDIPDPSGFLAERFDSRAAAVAKGGGDRATEDAVLAALTWLARHQGADGSWRAEDFSGACPGIKCAGKGERGYDPGMTGLVLLAFLGAGYGPASKEEIPDPVKNGPHKLGKVVKDGLRWLVARQDREGCVGERGMKYMYNHAVATAALCEATGMSSEEFVREPARRAVSFLLGSQNPGKGWRYSSKCGDNDTSVTGWAVTALKCAEFASIKVPRRAFEEAKAWLDEATERDGYFATGYNARWTGKVFVPGKNENFDHHPCMSAISVTLRLFVRPSRSEPTLASINLIVSDLPAWGENKIDYYYWYYGTMASYQYDGPAGPIWKRWNQSLKKALLPHQHPLGDGCAAGSWDSDQERWGAEGGRVYATAINALTLETYYRYPIVAPSK